MGLDFQQFNSSLEGIVMALKLHVEEIRRDLYGPEQAPATGMLKRFDSFLVEHETREEERDKAQAARDEEMKERHKQNRFRLNAIIGILGILVPVLIAFLVKH